jgi:hypothetical protein
LVLIFPPDLVIVIIVIVIIKGIISPLIVRIVLIILSVLVSSNSPISTHHPAPCPDVQRSSPSQARR